MILGRALLQNRSSQSTLLSRGGMHAMKTLVMSGATVLFAGALCAAQAQQDGRPRDSTADEQAKMPTPAVEPPPKPFKTAEEHYKYLLEKAHGGTKHTMSTIPVWSGLWAAGNNTMPSLFLVNGTLSNAWKPGATGQGRRADAAVREAIQASVGPKSRNSASSSTTGSRTASTRACRVGSGSRTSRSS